MEILDPRVLFYLAVGLALVSLTLVFLLADPANKNGVNSNSRLFAQWFRRTPGARIDNAEKPTEDVIEVSKESEMPDGWFTSLDLFELERRSIFSKTWLLTTHISHFRKPGDYQTFNIASYAIFLIQGKDGILRGFHNVCRHRAYTVTRKPAGSSLVLGCKYHGWSYDTKGALVKAPHFDNVPGFDKASNSLFEVGVKTDDKGLVWVRLSGADEEDPEEIPSFSIDGISKRSFALMTLESEGAVNWKFDSKLKPPDLQVDQF
jgi:nitrite reductase/ring-hydroxylating ferredoxin subunit